MQITARLVFVSKEQEVEHCVVVRSNENMADYQMVLAQVSFWSLNRSVLRLGRS
jgi:hypothetical protein